VALVNAQFAAYECVSYRVHVIHILPSYFHSFLAECDGMVQQSDPVCDSGTEAMEKWMSSFSPPRKTYNVGPQKPSGPADAITSGDLASSPGAKEIVEFLDSTLQHHGPRSILYVSNLSDRRSMAFLKSAADIIWNRVGSMGTT
jgi:hypothetical protein